MSVVSVGQSVLNMAQIGVGYWGPNLLRNLVASDGIKVKHVADLSPDRRSFVKGLYPAVEVSDDIERILRDDSIQAVVIATPAASHYELTMKSLEAGKHVLVEKPMAGTVDEIDHIGELADRKGLVAMVGHTFLFNPAVRYVKEMIDTGQLGELRYIYSQRLNLGRIRSDVDALWNLAPHDVSIIQYLLDDAQPSVISRHGMDYVQRGIDDVVFMHVEYPSKVMANIHVSWLDPRKIRRMTIVGSQKMVVYDDVAENKIAIFDKGIDPIAVLGQDMDFDDPGTFTFNLRSGDVLLPRISWQEPLKAEIDHFCDCISNGTSCCTGVDHARGVVRILSETNR